MFHVFQTHKSMFQMFHLFSVLCYIHVASVLRCLAGGWWIGVLGPADGGAVGQGTLGECSSSTAHPNSRLSPAGRVGERKEGSGERPEDAVTGAQHTRGECPLGRWGPTRKGILFWCFLGPVTPLHSGRCNIRGQFKKKKHQRHTHPACWMPVAR